MEAEEQDEGVFSFESNPDRVIYSSAEKDANMKSVLARAEENVILEMISQTARTNCIPIPI